MRKMLPSRRFAETRAFHLRLPTGAIERYFVTVGYYPASDRHPLVPDMSKPGEIFINSSQKSGSQADINASDAAVAASIALQHGATLDELRHAMRRYENGEPQSPLGAALDQIAGLSVVSDDEKE